MNWAAVTVHALRIQHSVRQTIDILFITHPFPPVIVFRITGTHKEKMCGYNNKLSEFFLVIPAYRNSFFMLILLSLGLPMAYCRDVALLYGVVYMQSILPGLTQ